jgi:hypothetical protein
MNSNYLRLILQSGLGLPEDMTPEEMAALSGEMPQPRYDVAPMQQNTMRVENGPEAGRVVDMNFRPQAQAPQAQAPAGDELQQFRDNAAKQGILTNADLEAFLKTGRAPQRQQQAQAAPQKLGAPVEVVGKGKGRYSQDGRSVVFADGSAQDLHPEASMQAFLDSFQMKKAAQDLKRGDLDIQQTEQQMRLAAQPKPVDTSKVDRQVFKDSLDLKKDFDSTPEVKGFKEVRAAWDQIETALQSPSAANDLAAATKFMKLLDPGSVVRESELVMAMQASGKLDQFLNTAKRLQTGEKLTPKQREDFYNAGRALYEASMNRYQTTVEQYRGIGQKYGLDTDFLSPKENKQPQAARGRGFRVLGVEK